jgi:gas vesicle protein
MAVRRCPQCAFLNTDDEVEQGVCSACQAPLALAPAPPVREVAVPPADSLGPSRAIPFMLGLLLGGLIGAVGLWAALMQGAPLPGGGVERTAAFQAVQAAKAQAEDKARESEAGRQDAESARADAAKALDAVNQKLADAQKQKDEAEQRAKNALARLADEQGRRAALEKDLAEARKPKLVPTFSSVRDWQLIGPFQTATGQAHDAVFPPEREPVQLGKAYDGYGGKVKWQPYHGADDRVDLSRFFNYVYAGDAYAVSWVHSDKDQDVTLSIGSDDGVVVWVNREKVHDVQGARPASPGEDTAKAHLKQGWNEVMAKVDNIGGDWALYLEFRTADGGLPLKVYSTNTPPPAAGK